MSSLYLTFLSFLGELHIFQCSSHSAQAVVDDLNYWMRKHGIAHHHLSGSNNGGGNNGSIAEGSNGGGTAPGPDGPNINVKEAVHVFNAIAAQRETLVLYAFQVTFWTFSPLLQFLFSLSLSLSLWIEFQRVFPFSSFPEKEDWWDH